MAINNKQPNCIIRTVAGKEVLLDEEDYYNPKVQNVTLILTKDGHVYARDKKTRKTTALARIVMNAKKGELVDHRNRKPLDNRQAFGNHEQNR